MNLIYFYRKLWCYGASKMQIGSKVRLKTNPSRIGILGNETDGPAHRQRVLVNFLDGEEDFVLLSTLEAVTEKAIGSYDSIKSGSFGFVDDLRRAITYYRLSGKLANLIYSMNTTNTDFFPHQFKPVIQFLQSPSNGILIADEVGLGKTIEAGLIWAELRAREDAKRLLIICPAILRDKWKDELSNRFGVNAEIVDAHELHQKLQAAQNNPQMTFALIASMQGVRPPKNKTAKTKINSNPILSSSAHLEKFIHLSKDVDVMEEKLLDMVIFDEAHYLRNKDTQINKLGRMLRPISQYLVLLSATPVHLDSIDLFNLLNIIDPEMFEYEYFFQQSIAINRPFIELRNLVLAKSMKHEDFKKSIIDIIEKIHPRKSLQLEYLRDSSDTLSLDTYHGRSELADQLDQINPLTKIVTRTLKRDVQEMRVIRTPRVIRVKMSDCEQRFYAQVTESVRQFCKEKNISTGFIATIPQRQMSSSMAAACDSWKNKRLANPETLDELHQELIGSDEEKTGSSQLKIDMGSLMHKLIEISESVGGFINLSNHDEKYKKLRSSLKSYWQDQPNKKIVLFSFYRGTLKYLQDRLAEDGILSVIVQGGMDKHQAIQEFKNSDGPSILLASEVASEGVDLQFSSVIINYDLPWNPMRIEQRIGRIDRIGQQADRILIWNFLYEKTLDERVYDRLLDRLGIFERALGGMEEILGDQISSLTTELLSHNLTPAEEEERINRTGLAIENNRKQQEILEQEASHLIAHGDFIQNTVKAAHELGRYIRGEDLMIYFKDFIALHYQGSRLIETDQKMIFNLEWSADGRSDFKQFLDHHKLQEKTRILSARAPSLWFENKTGNHPNNLEKITQDHPLIRFVTEKIKSNRDHAFFHQISAIELPIHQIKSIKSGIYIYIIERWNVSGIRDVEQLAYRAIRYDNAQELPPDQSEYLVNTAALQGRDWLGAKYSIDTHQAAEIFDEHREILRQTFNRYKAQQESANKDRISAMVDTLEKRREDERNIITGKIENYRKLLSTDNKKNMIPLEEGKLKKIEERFKQRMAEIDRKKSSTATSSFVCAGIINVFEDLS